MEDLEGKGRAQIPDGVRCTELYKGMLMVGCRGAKGPAADVVFHAATGWPSGEQRRRMGLRGRFGEKP